MRKILFRSGFTFGESFLVVAAIPILATVIIIGVTPYFNPSPRLQKFSRAELLGIYNREKDGNRGSNQEKLEFADNELIIKFKEGYDFQRLPQSLKELNQKHNLAKSENVFPNLRNVGEIKQKFPKRTIRLPKDAKLPNLSAIYKFTFKGKTKEDILTLIEEYKSDPAVEYAEPNFIVHTTQATPFPNDPFFWSKESWYQPYDDLWGLKKIQADKAWSLAQGEGVVVAVVDTGLDYTHPDIQANVWKNPGEIPGNSIDDDGNGYVDDDRGWDFTHCEACTPPKYQDNNLFDDQGHGTHVAGIIAAVGNNGIGIIGVAPKAKIMPAKGLNNLGSGSLSDLADALRYAADNGADVINNSWGPSRPFKTPQLLREVIDYAHGLGSVIVAAAGNFNVDIGNDSFGFYPANLDKVIAVASYDHTDQKSDYSNWGNKIDVAAPGGDSAIQSGNASYRNILSLRASGTDLYGDGGNEIVNENYVRARGTSMASPHVAGVAALILSRTPNLTNELVRAVIQGSGDDVGIPGFDVYSGFGRVNAYNALLKADLASSGFPELAVVLEKSKSIVAPGSPVPLTIKVESFMPSNITGTALVEVFDGDPKNGGALLWEKNLALLPGVTSNSIPVSVVIPNSGAHTLFTVVDRHNTIKELVEQNNKWATPLYVFTHHFIKNRITVNPFIQWVPRISGNRIVWEDKRNQQWDIYLYDLGPDGIFGTKDCYQGGRCEGEFQITSNTWDQRFPSIDGDKIVYVEINRNGNPDIYFYDLSSSKTQQITTDQKTQSFPSVSGDKIVWQDMRNGNPDIYLYDLATNVEKQITTATSSEIQPSISGNQIAWIDNSPFSGAVSLYNLESGTEQTIATGSSSMFSDGDISEKKIVWTSGWRDQTSGDGGTEIDIYDATTGQKRLITRGEPYSYLEQHSYPQFAKISGDRVVWNELSPFLTGGDDIYFYDLGTNEKYPVTDDFEQQAHPDVSGDKIIWEDYGDEGISEIYMATYKPFPGAVTNFVASSSGQRINLDWADTNNPDFKEYTLYRSTTQGGPYEKLAAISTQSSYADESGLSCATTYWYRVTVVDKTGNESSYSNEASAKNNCPPVLNPIGNKTAAKNRALYFKVTATDPENDPLVFSAQNLPKGAGFTGSGNTYEFLWAPTGGQRGSYQVTFIVSERDVPSLEDRETITITVQ